MLKFAVAKIFGSTTLYKGFNEVPVWLSDMDSPTVVWYDRDTEARENIDGKNEFVAVRNVLTDKERADIIKQACEMLATVSDGVDVSVSASPGVASHFPGGVTNHGEICDFVVAKHGGVNVMIIEVSRDA